MLTIDDIPLVQESSDTIKIFKGSKVLGMKHTEIYYASSKGWYIIVRDGRSIPIERIALGEYTINIQGIT